jgi:hypothetical protein
MHPKPHRCSNCGREFEVTSAVRVANSARFLLDPFWGPKAALFNFVRCPACGHQEKDESIRFLWFFTPVRGMILLLLLVLAWDIIQTIIDSSK